MQNMILIPSSLLFGCMFPLELMPATMQQLAHFLPQYWLLDTFSNLQQRVSMGQLSLNLIILIAFSVALSFIHFHIALRERSEKFKISIQSGL
ncbi:hypothetical protein [Paenibacillus sp. Z3-2]